MLNFLFIDRNFPIRPLAIHFLLWSEKVWRALKHPSSLALKAMEIGVSSTYTLGSQKIGEVLLLGFNSRMSSFVARKWRCGYRGIEIHELASSSRGLWFDS
ncbi:hypothetical protein RRG08_059664 [Elysia crispata]|uniref:Uncharacterized protein n=1 Tax=Elysia crispata TaxID=231223 RepID=A0AAE1EB76_9GAST|nr:hypothetical protein RRG08_059664 [Elysia crispata]